MSEAVKKYSIYDDRVVQESPSFAVERGALSLTNAPFTALSQTGSQHTYNVSVPSEGVFCDRAIEWTSTCFLQFVASPNSSAVGAPVVVFGRDCALAPFPLHTLVQTATCTINDATVSMNTGDVLREVMRLTDLNRNRIQRTCPTMLDSFGNYNDAYQTQRNPLADYSNSGSREEVPNGAWGQVFFTTPNGTTLAGSGTYTANVGATPVTVTFTNGVPVQSAGVTAYPIFVSFRSTEKIILSPFIFSDIYENSVGIFGVQNMQFVFNMTNPSQTAIAGRVLRSCSNITTISALSYNNGAVGGSPFANSRLNVIFLTPPLSIPLPSMSICSFAEYPRYVSNQTFATPLLAGQSTQISSQTLSLPCVPDLIVIYCKPQSYQPTDADWYLPITNISINLDNFSGLCSSLSTEQLYSISVMNGLEMDYNQWLGYAQTAVGSGATPPSSAKVGLTGGFLVLKPSRDITLQEGVAPSIVGNYNLQFNCTVNNWNTSAPGGISSATLYIVTINSGFFQTVRGSSRVIKGVLNEADVINAPIAPAGTHANLQRIVGGRSALHKLGNILSRVRDVMVHPMGGKPTGGAEGGSAEGGARSGGRPRGRTGLASRLM